jgi:Fe-S-cluster-containing hydrogenase component 2
MNRNNILLLVISNFFAIISLIAQPNIEWQKTLGGTLFDSAKDIEPTSDGGFIVAGISRSTDGDVTGNHGWMDYWVAKLASDGSLEWQKSYGGSHHDTATDILQTTDGGYIVAGRSASEDGQITNHHGSTDYWVLKLSSEGIIEWENSYGGYGSDFAYSIDQTSDGGYIVGGASDSVSGQVTGNHGKYDFWVVKLASDGTMEWEKTLGGSKDDFMYALEQTIDDGYILAGKSQSLDGDVTGNQGGGLFVTDFWVVKLSNDGEIEWEKSLGGTDHEVAYSVAQTNDGSYVASGVARAVSGDVTVSHGGWDYWVVKLSPDGELVWEKSLGGNYDDVAHSTAATNDGGCLISGSSKSNYIQVTGNNGGIDFWTVKLTSDGEIDWQKSMGGQGDDIAFSGKQTDEGGFIFTGQSSPESGEVTNHSSNDYWVVKLGPCGVNTELESEVYSIHSQEVALSSTFQWINCSDGAIIPGADSSSFSPELGGDYAVIVSNGSCIDTSACVNICPVDPEIIATEGILESTEIFPNLIYQWIECNTETPIEGAVDHFFEPIVNGDYAVIITGENCSITSECKTVCPESLNTAITSSATTIQSLSDTLNYTFQWIKCDFGSYISGATSPTFTPATSGNYAVIVTQGNCSETSECTTICLVDSNISVSNNTMQSAAPAGNSTFQWIDCSNQSFIDGETGQSYSPTTSGEYAVIITQGSCIDTSECISFCLTDINTVVTDNTIHSEADVGSSTFQWIDCISNSVIDGETGPTYTPTTSGDYAVIVTQGSCVDTSDCVTLCLIDPGVSIIEDLLQSAADPLTSTFQWIDCSDNSIIPGEVGQSFIPAVSGEYAVTINQASCIETTECITFCNIDTTIAVMGNTLQSTADPSISTFQWFDCNSGALLFGEEGQSFTPTVSGEYSVSIDQGLCYEFSECVNIVIVGLDEPINNGVKLFPNPVEDFLIIEVDAKRLGSVFSIYNSAGKKVSSGEIETTNSTVRLDDLPNGVYVIKLESPEEVISLRFVKS